MGVLQVDHASWMSEDLQIFDNEARKFFERECVPHAEKWIKQQHVDRAVWKKAGEAGLLCASTPEAYVGAGGTFAHEAVIIDNLGKLGIDGWGIPCTTRLWRLTFSIAAPKSSGGVGCRVWRRASWWRRSR